MKWLAYLFSLYILLLSGVTCDADSVCCQDETTATIPTRHTNDSDHKPACPCSPFFACGACHAVTIPETNTKIPNIPSPASTRYTIYDIQSLSDFPQPIWQPPQLAA